MISFLPLVAPRLADPRRLLENVTGPARRSIAARLFTGDLDLAAYSGNWDIKHRYVPSRSCAFCYWTYHMPHCVEDEWHVLLVCPLYSRFRHALPFTSEQVIVEGHDIQGEGCTERNLTALVQAILQAPRFDSIVDYLSRALKVRSQYRTRTRRA